MFCPQCGKINEDSTQYCPDCGVRLPQKVVRPRPNNTADSGITDEEELYKAVIGPKNQDYYLQRFANFDRSGTGISWHWPAFFVTFYWFLYRKMWLYAFIYFILPIVYGFVIGILAGILGKSSEIILGLANIVYWIAMLVLPPLYANALYYNHCNNKIAEVKASSRDQQRQLGELSAKGGTSNAALIVVLLLVFVAIMGILAAIAIPAYNDYATRAKLTLAVATGKTATVAASNYYSEHHQWPKSLDDAGFSSPPAKVVRAVSFNSENGLISVHIFGTPVDGSSVLFSPFLDENNQLAWQCSGPDIPDKFLPKECRESQ